MSKHEEEWQKLEAKNVRLEERLRVVRGALANCYSALMGAVNANGVPPTPIAIEMWRETARKTAEVLIDTSPTTPRIK